MRRCLLALALVLAACSSERRRQPPITNPQPTGPIVIEVGVTGYVFSPEAGGQLAQSGERFLVVELRFVNRDRDRTVTFDPSHLVVDTAPAATIAPAPGMESLPLACARTVVATRGSETCRVAFAIGAAAEPRRLAYAEGALAAEDDFFGRSPLPPTCYVSGREDTLEACSDGCSNDGNAYTDCDDSDCCTVRFDCGTGTYCGGPNVGCVSGPEASPSACRDACDNDGNSVMDCNDSGCCNFIACDATTFCGQQPDPFTGSLVLDDQRIGSLDSRQLPAGATPCHTPALVRVRSVSDGDTVQVDDVSGSGIEGSVRFIGVDTPEIGRDGAPSDCYAEAAAGFTGQLRNHLIWLTFDSECRDQFGRNLAYIHIGPETSQFFQRQLMRRGLAREFHVFPNVAYRELFESDEREAQRLSTGQWGVCN